MSFRIGIDLGGTKIEGILLSGAEELQRDCIATPTSYLAIIDAVVSMILSLSANNIIDSIGIGMPGAQTLEGLVKNSNTICLNGQKFQEDLQSLLGVRVSIANDANCFALSESVDGAAADAQVVFGVIIGTGVGGGVVFNKSVHSGVNRIAGEWGHNIMPPHIPRQISKARACYCGKQDCIEAHLSGAGASQTYLEMFGDKLPASIISENASNGCENANRFVEFYARQLAGSLSVIINVLDPDIIVLGGGLSAFPSLSQRVQ